jgi:hypothetical protein
MSGGMIPRFSDGGAFTSSSLNRGRPANASRSFRVNRIEEPIRQHFNFPLSIPLEIVLTDTLKSLAASFTLYSTAFYLHRGVKLYTFPCYVRSIGGDKPITYGLGHNPAEGFFLPHKLAISMSTGLFADLEIFTFQARTIVKYLIVICFTLFVAFPHIVLILLSGLVIAETLHSFTSIPWLCLQTEIRKPG